MSLWFVVPAHGRYELTRICLEQLRRTCDALPYDATAVVVAEDQNLYTAADLGFATVHRDNDFLARKFNDGIQLACDPNLNPEPADYVVRVGSDDWIDHRILLDLPPLDTVLAFQWAAFVVEDGRQLSRNPAGLPRRRRHPRLPTATARADRLAARRRRPHPQLRLLHPPQHPPGEPAEACPRRLRRPPRPADRRLEKSPATS